MERILLFLATACFLTGFVRTAIALRSGHYQHSRFNLLANALGFVFQTATLVVRGHHIRHCPLTNQFEMLVFLSWATVFLYLVIGSAYRISLLGAFTAPLVLVLQTIALVLPVDGSIVPPPANPWLEFHAALSVLAYGAFGLACMAGVMFLIQERQLKTHRLGPVFFEMPPIVHLATANRRLIRAGLLLLTCGLAAGVTVSAPPPPLMRVWGLIIWGTYVAILLGHRAGPRRLAVLSILAFLLALSSFGWLNYFAHRPHL